MEAWYGCDNARDVLHDLNDMLMTDMKLIIILIHDNKSAITSLMSMTQLSLRRG